MALSMDNGDGGVPMIVAYVSVFVCVYGVKEGLLSP